MLKNNINENTILKLKVEKGKFIHIYDNNAIVMHYVFGYMLNVRNGSYKCGFVKESLESVVNRLDDLCISYEIFQDKNITLKKDFGIDNKYLTYYNYGIKQLEIDKKIELLIQKMNCLNVDLESKLLDDFLDIVNKQ